MLCHLPMVYENIGMRNPGFFFEDARHGYIQYLSLSECYFAGKGAALVLPPNERARPSRRVSAAGCDIQQHLQSMFYLLRPEETLKMAVKLESVHPGRTRYLVVVSCLGRQDAEESCLLGIDCHARATVGLVLRVLADTAITLDGDGGFSVSVCGRQHIFKPVSVQAMWSALQTLHKVSSKAREQNYFLSGLSHDWVNYYEQRIESDRSCLNEWHAMGNLESRRPPSPDSVRSKPRKREETERVIRATLKEIMMSVDLDEVTSKYIRGRLEEDLDMDLGEFKPFIDQEMLTILGQMDAPTEIFDHVYLGSEWNASNLEELQKNGVRHILNVTREIDNFFPGMFTYLNVRVYDDEKTDLLKHWDDTFKYITKAQKEGSKVLVHCKMGVSRSASVVIAYAMKAYNWDFSQAWKHVKDKRNCVKPNNNFILQLETYQGILDAMKNKEKLQRSKSDTNLKSPTSTKDPTKKEDKSTTTRGETVEEINHLDTKKINNERPKSWSPNVTVAENILPTVPLSQSLESIDKTGTSEVTREDLLRGSSQKTSMDQQEARNVLMPCDNGQSYSVSQNKIVHLPGPGDKPLPKLLKSNQGHKRKGLVLNLTNQFEAASSKPASPVSEDEDNNCRREEEFVSTTSSTSTLVDCKNLMNKQEIDPFSTQLDRVFEREEKRDPATTVSRESPSRQSSWSSYDSAVVLDNNSVHSSWATLPSRNSSWGSYDMKTNNDQFGSSGIFPYDNKEIPWHPGTVRRTKQKLKLEPPKDEEPPTVKFTDDEDEDEEEEEEEDDDDDDEEEDVDNGIRIPSPNSKILNSGRLSTSAPVPSSLSVHAELKSSCLRPCKSESETQNKQSRTSVKQQKFLLEKRNRNNNNNNNNVEDSPSSDLDNAGTKTTGIVRYLKKEFEAKSTTNEEQLPKQQRSFDNKNNLSEATTKIRSLPSSPVINHPENKVQTKEDNNRDEDLSVRSLVGKYEIVRTNEVLTRNKDCCWETIDIHSPARSKILRELARRSAPIVINHSSNNYLIAEDNNQSGGSCRTSIVNDQKQQQQQQQQQPQQQHGRTHPLARLQVRPRHSSPVYNTM